MRITLSLNSKRSLSTSSKLLHGRNAPLPYAYKQLSNVELDIEPFEDQSIEQNRTESELTSYLSSLRQYLQRRRYAAPKYNNGDNKDDTQQPLHKPLYDYSKTKTTESDSRPSYYKFMEQIQKTNPDLYNDLNEPIPTQDLIDMNYLGLHENRHIPKILPDDEYPDWVWELVPESRKYWWNDLVQTPFENLSEVEKWGLLRKWRKTLMVCNNQWNKSHLGRLGKVRPKYNDPWPQPLTKMDINKYQQNDEHYQDAKEWSNRNWAQNKNRKRLETDSDYLWNQNMIIDNYDNKQNEFALENYDLNEDEFEQQTIDLAKYYGLQNTESNTDVDNDHHKKYGVVYDVKPKVL